MDDETSQVDLILLVSFLKMGNERSTHTHPNIVADLPAVCSTKAPRRNNASNTSPGSGRSMSGIAVVLWTLRK